MTFSQDYSASILDGALSGTLPALGFMGLSTTTPTDAGGNITEPTEASYARLAVSAADFSAAVAGSPSTKTNTATFTFAQVAEASWAGGADFTHVVFFSAATGGTFQGAGAISAGSQRNALQNDQLEIEPGGVTLTQE